MIIDRLDHWRELFAGPAWSTAFQALEALIPASPDGDTFLQGEDVILKVASYDTLPVEKAVLETHRRYLDIQLIIAGNERIDWFPSPPLAIKDPYNPEKDVQFYHRPGPAPAQTILTPGLFVVFFPTDAHMPQLITGSSPEPVKKAVVKFAVNLLTTKIST